jgi:hypothetical protein
MKDSIIKTKHNKPEKCLVESDGNTWTEIAEMCAAALVKWDVYRDARGVLVHVNGRELVELNRHNGFMLIEEATDFYGYTPKKTKKNPDAEPSTCPSPKVVDLTLACINAFPRIAGVTSCPVVSLSGDMTCAGYDAATELYVAPPVDVHTAGLPLTAKDCADELLALVSDFPFLEDRDRGAWLAMLISGLMRPSIDGAVPAFVITATTRGTGKTLLAQAALDMIHGPGSGINTEPSKEEEAQKAILAEVLFGTRVLVWDNLANGRPFGGAVIDSLITSTVVKGRALGSNSIISAKIPFVLVCTGNNVKFQADTARRVISCRLQTSEERPEDRQGYRIEDLRVHITQNRARLLGVAAQLIRLGMASHAQSPRVGSFEAWGSTVGKIVRSAGFDLAPCFASADGSSDETAAAREYLLAYIERNWGERGISAQTILMKAFDPEARPGERSDADTAAVDAMATLSHGTIKTHEHTMIAGRILGSFEKSNIGGYWLTRKLVKGCTVWAVKKL